MGFEDFYVRPGIYAETFESLAQGALSVALGILGLIIGLIVIGVVALWCLHSIGLAAMARRRGIYHAWMAWVPVCRLWVLGCVSDQYQLLNVDRRRSLRRTLPALEVAKWILYGLLGAAFWYLQQSGSTLAGSLQVSLWIAGPMALLILGLLRAIFQYIAYYDLFRSADPSNGALYLIMGILFAFCMPLFVFSVRNRDGGMPPRRPRAEPAYAPEEPVSEPAAEEPKPEATDE